MYWKRIFKGFNFTLSAELGERFRSVIVMELAYLNRNGLRTPATYVLSKLKKLTGGHEQY